MKLFGGPGSTPAFPDGDFFSRINIDQQAVDVFEVAIPAAHSRAVLHGGGGNPDIVGRNRCPLCPQAFDQSGVELGGRIVGGHTFRAMTYLDNIIVNDIIGVCYVLIG